MRNLSIKLLKRLFICEDKLSPESLNHIASALGAISRMFPQIYSTVIKEKLSQLLAGSKENLLKRAIPFLFKRPETLDKVEQAIFVRLQGCIANMDLSEVIKYDVASLASHNTSINSSFQDIINRQGFEIEDILKSTPAQSIKDKAIEWFLASASFASAYSNGINILVPHAKFFNDKDVEVIFSGVLKNECWNINQILNAGGIGEVFAFLYKLTKENVVNHAQIWLGFINNISGAYSFEELNTLLKEDKLI